jgi:hypothetical protein
MKNNEREIEKSLECVIPAPQLKEYGKMLSGENQRKGRLENELKSVSSKFKAQVLECDSNIERYSQLLQSEREMRDVKCIITYNHPEAGFKTTFRADTGEKVSLEQMTSGEMEDLFINCLGLQADESETEYFTFNNRSSVLVDNRDADNFTSAGWKTVFGPVNDREMVKHDTVNLENSDKYRVIRGVAGDGKTVFSLQEKIELSLLPEAKPEKKPRKAKEATAPERCENVHEKSGLRCVLDKGHDGNCNLNMCKEMHEDGVQMCKLVRGHTGEHEFVNPAELR